jgi:fatty acid CoA ligase FadD9
MSTDAHEERLARRVADLYATDQQFADARPSEAITAAIEQPGLRLPQLVQTVMVGYADRPALGHRAVQFLNDPESDAPHWSCCPGSRPSATASCGTAPARSRVP